MVIGFHEAQLDDTLSEYACPGKKANLEQEIMGEVGSLRIVENSACVYSIQDGEPKGGSEPLSLTTV